MKKEKQSKFDMEINEEYISKIKQFYSEGKIFDILSEEFDEKEFCKKHNIEEDYFQEVYSKISPLIDEAYKIDMFGYPRNISYQVFRYGKTSYDNLMTLSDFYKNDLAKIKDDISKKKGSLLNLISYFFIVESVYSHYLDIIIFTLTFIGHDYYSRGKYITKFSKISKTSLHDKAKFLNHHGLNIITEGYKRELRNSIAHSTFFIDEEGNIDIIDGEDKIDIKKEIERTSKAIINLEVVNLKCQSEFIHYAFSQIKSFTSPSSDTPHNPPTQGSQFEVSPKNHSR